MTKQELREYYWIKRNITKLEAKLEELEAIATRNTTQLKKDAIMAQGGTSDRVGNTVAEMEVVRKQLERQVKHSYEILNRIEEDIQKLPARESYLIRARYIEMLSWEQIAVDMNYDWRHVHKIHSKALEMLA